MPVRNYLYGCLPPDNVPELLAIMDTANKYQNALVAIELERRAAVRATTLGVSPEWNAAVALCEDLKKKVQALEEARRQARQQARKRLPAPADGLKGLRAEWKKAREAEKLLRGPAYAAAREACKPHESEAVAKHKAARADSKLYWGTYGLIDAAAKAFRKGPPPQFKRFRGEGRVGVSFQYGLPGDELWEGTSTLLRLATVAPRQRFNRHGRPLPLSRHPERFKELWLRIGSVPGKATPRWTKVRVIWHRELPEGSDVRQATLQRRLVGGKAGWSLMLTIRIPEASLPEHQPAKDGSRKLAQDGACGIDIGYRVEADGGQRVACAIGDDDVVTWLKLPADMVARWQECRDLRSERDLNFNAAKERLQAWLRDRPGLPDWLASVDQTLHAWRSCRRLSRLVYDWSVYYPVVDGEAEILPALRDWRRLEERLHQEESQLRDKLQARRKDMYRCWCAKLRKRYRTAYIEQMKLTRAIHDVERPKDEQLVEPAQRASAAVVSLHEFVLSLTNCGMRVVRLPPEDTTLTCHACGRKTKIDAAVQVRYECEHCGAEWDQDENAARNLLTLGGTCQPEPA